MKRFLLAVLVALPVAAAAQGDLNNMSVVPTVGSIPSFDCTKARAPDELAICQESRLAELDQITSRVFNRLRSRYSKPDKKSERDQFFMTTRIYLNMRRACGGDILCIMDRQIDQIRGYERAYEEPTSKVPAWVEGYRKELLASYRARKLPVQQMPEKLNECSTAVVAGISDRFGEPLKPTIEDDNDPGINIYFSNGGSQVSYSREPEVYKSRFGDKVQMCLVSVPKDCPPGDDRGKEYKTTNLRTGKFWVHGPDQHMCGGA